VRHYSATPLGRGAGGGAVFPMPLLMAGKKNTITEIKGCSLISGVCGSMLFYCSVFIAKRTLTHKKFQHYQKWQKWERRSPCLKNGIQAA